MVLNPYFLVSLVVQVLLLVHCVRTGRNQIWIWVLILGSAAGALAYLIVEIIPDLFRSRAAGRAARGVRSAIDPGRTLRELEAAAQRTGDVASRQRYAAELVRQGRAATAVDIYRSALTGLYAEDPDLLYGLAQAQFAAGESAQARATLDSLRAARPGPLPPDAHLLYARALEGEGETSRALDEYAAVAAYYAGAEARLRHASLLAASGRRPEARAVVDALLDHARHAPRHYQKAQAQWLDEARRLAAGLA